jgi:hypothetical protein
MAFSAFYRDLRDISWDSQSESAGSMVAAINVEYEENGMRACEPLCSNQNAGRQ